MGSFLIHLVVVAASVAAAVTALPASWGEQDVERLLARLYASLDQPEEVRYDDKGSESMESMFGPLDPIGGGNIARNLDSLGGGNLARSVGSGNRALRNLDELGGGNLVRNLDSLGGGNLARNLDSLGGGNLARNLDSLGGGNLARNLDSLGGGNLARSLDYSGRIAYPYHGRARFFLRNLDQGRGQNSRFLKRLRTDTTGTLDSLGGPNLV